MNVTHVGVEMLMSALADKFSVVGIDNDRLAQEVISSQQRLSDDPRSCLFEDTAFMPLAEGPGAQLLEGIQALAQNSGLRVSEVWSQVHQPLESTSLHHHLGNGNVAAFVYYVTVPERAGYLCFEFDHGYQHSILPKQGDLYFFPSWVKHKVTKNLSGEMRISIAGNLVPI